MLQNEINLTASTLPGWKTQAIPQVIASGIGMPLFQFPVMDKNGAPIGNPALTAQGIPTFDELYKQAFGKPPSGPKWDAMLLANHMGTQMQRLIVLPKGSPNDALEALRPAFQQVAHDPEFAAAFEKTTSEKPEVARYDEVEPLLARMRKVDPAIKKVVVQSITE
jgi:hypothetical protein